MEKYSEYKDSGVQWLGEIPSHWMLLPFKSNFSLGKGLSITKENLAETGTNVISYGQIHSKSNVATYVVNELYRHVSPEYIDSAPQCIVHKEDFLFADTSEDVEGSGNFVRIDNDETTFAGYHTIIARNRIPENGHFLSYLFQSPKWKQQIWTQVHGVKVFSVSRGILNSCKLIVPPLSEQQAIVSYLDDKCGKIDRLLENKAKELELLAEMKQCVIADAVTKGLNPDVTMKDSGIPWLPHIPEHWKLDTLRRFIKLVSIKNRPDKQLLSVTREQGVIVRDVDSKEENHNFIPEDLSNYKYVEPGDFCINKMKSWQGSYGVSEYEGIVSPAYFVCKLSGVDKRFFSMAIRSKVYVSFFGQYSKGIRVDQWDLSPIAMKSIPFFLPPIDEQKAIVAHIEEKVSKIDALADMLQKEIESIKEYKQRLVSDVVTGQIKVNKL